MPSLSPHSTVWMKMRSKPSQHLFSVIDLTSMGTKNYKILDMYKEYRE